MNIGTEFPDLGTLAAVIARSQIVVAALVMDRPLLRDDRQLPAGFGDVDIAVLEWIAAEGRRVGSRLARF